VVVYITGRNEPVTLKLTNIHNVIYCSPTFISGRNNKWLVDKKQVKARKPSVICHVQEQNDSIINQTGTKKSI
jgi:hypothetical protein